MCLRFSGLAPPCGGRAGTARRRANQAVGGHKGRPYGTAADVVAGFDGMAFIISWIFCMYSG